MLMRNNSFKKIDKVSKREQVFTNFNFQIVTTSSTQYTSDIERLNTQIEDLRQQPAQAMSFIVLDAEFKENVYRYFNQVGQTIEDKQFDKIVKQITKAEILMNGQSLSELSESFLPTVHNL